MKLALGLEYPLALPGGVSVLVETLARGFAQRGHQLVLVSPDTPQTLAKSPAAPCFAQHLPWDPAAVSPATAKDLARRLAQTDIDLAHFNCGGNFGWGNRFPGHCPMTHLARLGVPVLNTVHLVVNVLDGYCGPQKPLALKLALLPLAWLGKMHQLWHVRREIAVSQHDLRKVRRWYWPLRRRFVQFYHSRLKADALPPEPPARDKVILNVGHLAWRKGQAFLAGAFAAVAARHPEWKLFLAGHDGGDDTAARIRELARAGGLEDRIILAGERTDALELMRRAAIYAQPSYWEALGLALQEAMACGCACVGTRAGGIPELIDGRDTGLLVGPGNTGQLAAALESLITQPAERERLGRAAALSIRQRGMTADAMVARHLTLYESLRADAERRFVVATPGRSVCDDNARALERHGRLRFLALGTRRGTTGVPAERTRLLPAFGLAAYAAAKMLPPFAAESFRFRLHPWFDRWVTRQLAPGDHVISSYGYANEAFRAARARGGRTFLDGGNSHPENFWAILTEEHRRWNCPYPPVARHHYERARAMMEHVDFVLSPSAFVTRSFLERGFAERQILRNVYPVDLSLFQPAPAPRPKERPLTIINTGSLSLRKGTPYLLEAFRLVRQRHPSARLRLMQLAQDDVKTALARFSDLPIDWLPRLGHADLARWLQGADIFVLPSLEDGFARTVTEALACGLPVVLTPNTGAADFVEPGVNGDIVPIRDPRALAGAMLAWADRILSGAAAPARRIATERLTWEHFEAEFISQLEALEL